MGGLTPGPPSSANDLPGWTWDPQAERWQEGFRHLQRYVDRNGHAHVAKSYKDHDDYSLGSWVARQRDDYARGRLDADRVRRLEALPGWRWRVYRSYLAKPDWPIA